MYPSTPLRGIRDLPSETGVPCLSNSGDLLLASGSIATVSGWAAGVSSDELGSLGVEGFVEEVELLFGVEFDDLFEDLGWVTSVGASSEVWLEEAVWFDELGCEFVFLVELLLFRVLDDLELFEEAEVAVVEFEPPDGDSDGWF